MAILFISLQEEIMENMDAYDKRAKAKQCLDHKIDIMIDDSVGICGDCIKNGIEAILMDTPYNKYSSIKRVKSWEEFYEYISSYKKDKIK